MPKKFSGNLEWIHPDQLVDENHQNNIDDFFLTLGVIFNDLKGLIMFEKMLMENYDPPEDDKPTDHLGNYSGIKVQIQKLVAGTINEFFKFLEVNSSIFTEREFLEILNRLSKSDKQLWDNMIAAANGKLPSADKLLNAVLKIRNNVAFHYDQSGKSLRRGFISYFFNKVSNDINNLAYYSLGDSIETTRFYFSDAAVGEALQITAGKGPKENSIQDPSFKEYQREITGTINTINIAIASLLKNYIQARRGRPRKL